MGVSFDVHTCRLTSREGLSAESQARLIYAARDQGFELMGDESNILEFELDTNRQSGEWDTFFAKFWRYFAVGSEFTGTNGDGCIYGYRIEEDGVVFLDGRIEFTELKTLTVELSQDEALDLVAGRTLPAKYYDVEGAETTFASLRAALLAPVREYSRMYSEPVEGWVATVYKSGAACITGPRSEILAALASAEREVAVEQGAGRELRGGEAEARERLDPGEGGASE